MTWYTQEKRVDEWMQITADFKYCVMNYFIVSGIPFMMATHSIRELSTFFRRLDCFSVSFPGDVREESGPRELVSVNRRIRLHNGHFVDLSAEFF